MRIFGKKREADKYLELANLLYVRLVASGKTPDMKEICGQHTTKAFVNKWQLIMAAAALATLATAAEKSPKAKPLIGSFFKVVVEHSSLETELALETFNAAWNDLQRLLAGGHDLAWAQQWLKPVGYNVEGNFGASLTFSHLVCAHISAVQSVMDAAVMQCEKY